jgi:hypothetical protein
MAHRTRAQEVEVMAGGTAETSVVPPLHLSADCGLMAASEEAGPVGSEAQFVKIVGRPSSRFAKTETEMLSAFFTYQEHADVRFRRLKADVSTSLRNAKSRRTGVRRPFIALELAS